MAGVLGGLELIIVSEPPDKFYNQQGGKYDCFVVKVGLRGSSSHEALYMREGLPLEVRLLYENQKVVENQAILQLMNPPQINLKTRTGELRVRINEVSKNHQSQRFRLRISVGRVELGANVRPFPTVRSALSTPIKVLSKRARRRSTAPRRVSPPSVLPAKPETVEPVPARSRKRRRPAENASEAAARHHVESWTSGALALLRQLEWMEVGYERRVVGPGEEIVDKTRPIYRCPSCHGCQFVNSRGIHAAECALARLIGSAPQGDTSSTPSPRSAFDTLASAIRSVERAGPTELVTRAAPPVNVTQPRHIAGVVSGPGGARGSNPGAGPRSGAPFASTSFAAARELPFQNALGSMALDVPSRGSEFFPSCGSIMLSRGVSATDVFRDSSGGRATAMEDDLGAELAVAGILSESFEGLGYAAVNKRGQVIGMYSPSGEFKLVSTTDVDDSAMQRLQAHVVGLYEKEVASAGTDVDMKECKLCMVGRQNAHATLRMLKEALFPARMHESRRAVVAS